MIIKKQYIVPSVKTTSIDEQPLMAGSPNDWEVHGDDETAGGQGAKGYNSFDDKESDDDFSSTPFK